MPPRTHPEIPPYLDLIYPTIRAVATLGGSAQAREITDQVLADIGATEEQLAEAYGTRPKSVLVDRLDWARSYSALGGALERPERGLFVLTPLGREILALPEADGRDRVREIDKEIRSQRRRPRLGLPAEHTDGEVVEPPDSTEGSWREQLLTRLHRLSPEGFEAFVVYLLKSYGMELTRVGGTGDEGIDAIGLAPISDVLSSRVAVQAKRHDPGSALGREVVALFQRDAAAAGAERAVLVTLGRFTPAAGKAATAYAPTVNLIDGDRICDLVEKARIGVRPIPTVIEAWFDRFA